MNEDPECLQVGKYCRYADGEGVVHDALIIGLVSVLDGIVNLSYDKGDRTVHNVRYSVNPAPRHWGCAEDGEAVHWGEVDRGGGEGLGDGSGGLGVGDGIDEVFEFGDIMALRHTAP